MDQGGNPLRQENSSLHYEFLKLPLVAAAALAPPARCLEWRQPQQPLWKRQALCVWMRQPVPLPSFQKQLDLGVISFRACAGRVD